MAAGLSTSTLLALSTLLAASFFIGELFERIGIESIIGYIVTGLLLGPIYAAVAPAIGFLDPSWALTAESVAGFGTIGATLIIFRPVSVRRTQ